MITKDRLIKSRAEGRLHIIYGHLTEGYKNVKVPYIASNEKQKKDLWIISDPRDCEKIARQNVKKMPNLTDKIADSILSTTSVEHWKEQRGDFVEAFIPNTILPDLLPGIIKRAEGSIKILENQRPDNKYIDMSEFFLNETQAQLQLNMFGFDETFEEETNKKIREAFNNEDRKYMIEWGKKASTTGSGPLAEAFQDREAWTKTEPIGNAVLFAFAGHDTTGHTLAWLFYELAHNLKAQTKLQNEVDKYWKKHDQIEIKYLDELPFMTRCITEILRMWPANSNGTYRVLEQEEDIFINDTEQIKLPVGTYVQIPNWTRHRSKKLWGDDVNLFNPERDFKDEEIWDNQGFSFKNPYSDRFSPFTYPPRDCIGKNFSQLEMRVMLLLIVKKFKFNSNITNMEGINGVTMGPRDPFDSNKIAMPLIITPRN